MLIEGQPGAGKTTFLKLVACLLARDALGIPSPDGARWSARVGLGEGPLLTPIFLRASHFVPFFEKAGAGRQNSRSTLAELIAELCLDGEAKVPKNHWGQLLEQGEALLLVDGVDEVADAALRTRILDILRDAAKHWQSRIIASSRPIDTRALGEMGFATATIEPFGPSVAPSSLSPPSPHPKR